MVEQVPNQDLYEAGRRVLLAAEHGSFVCSVSIRQTGQSGANEPLVRKLTQPGTVPRLRLRRLERTRRVE
jgi:hypothetical protein